MFHKTRLGQALATTVRELRGSRTQKEMAEKSGIPASTWSKIESSRTMPRQNTTEKLVRAFDLEMDELEELVLRNFFRSSDDRQRRLEARPRALDLPREPARRMQIVLDEIDQLHRCLELVEHQLLALGRALELGK